MAVFRGVPPHSLIEHQDVDAQSIADGETIVYNAAGNNFVPGPATAAAETNTVKANAADATPSTLDEKVVAGSNVTINVVTGISGDALEISSAAPGEVNTASNLGAGQGWYKQKIGQDLQFRGLKSESGVDIDNVTDPDSLIVSSPLTNAGGGAEIARAAVGTDREYRTLTSTGATVTITQNADTVNLEAVPTGNLSVGTVGATTVDVDIDTGTSATIPAATGSEAGLLSAADKTKLDTVGFNAAADQIAATVSVAATPTNYTAVSSDVEAHLEGIDDQIGISSTGVTVIKSLSDLPTPVDVDGVDSIRLEDGEYLLTVPLSSPYPLAPPVSNGQATWKTVNRSLWTYTGTDACFRDINADGEIELRGLTDFAAPNGAMLNIQTTTGFWRLQATGPVRFTNCKELGLVDGGPSASAEFNLFYGSYTNFCDGLVMNNLLFQEQNTITVLGNNCARLDYDGQSFDYTVGETVTGGTSGATGVVEIDRDSGTSGQLVLSSVSGTFQDNETLIGSVSGVALVDGVLQNTIMFTVGGANSVGSSIFVDTLFSNGIHETLFDLKTAALAGLDSISLKGCSVEGGVNGQVFAAGSADIDTPKVFSAGNTFVRDTLPSALAVLSSNATDTIIAASNTPVPIAGTWIEKPTTSLHTVSAAGVITYTGTVAHVANVAMSFSLEGQGGADVFTVYLYKNGSPIADFKRPFEASGVGDPISVTMVWSEIMDPGDTFQAYIENNTDSSDVLAQEAVIRI